MKQIAAVALGLSLSVGATAFQPIDMKAIKYLEYGYNPTIGSFSPDDPEVESGSATDLVFISAAAKMPYRGRMQRSFFDVSYQYFETDASTSELGQEVQRYRASWQHQFARPINKELTVWYGGGGALGYSSYTGRHYVNSDGFLGATESDKADLDVAAIGSAVLEYAMPQYKRITLGLTSQYELPLANSVEGFKVGAYIFYKF